MTVHPERNRPSHVPLSTYRLQVHAAFTLRDAVRVVPYLERLGISTCYTSPYFTAAPGSTHGYDVWNHNEINPELGGDEAHREFVAAIGAAGMKHIVDFVPNHMGIGAGGNAWWTDVLENGPSSYAAAFFDIDWAPLKAELHAKLLLPILGDQYGRVLDRGELRLEYQGRRAHSALLRSGAADQSARSPSRTPPGGGPSDQRPRRREPAPSRVLEHPQLARKAAAVHRAGAGADR